MVAPKKRFENYQPTPEQALKIAEVDSSFKFVYVVLQKLKPGPADKGYSLKYLNHSIDHLEEAWIKAKMAVIYGNETKEE